MPTQEFGGGKSGIRQSCLNRESIGMLRHATSQKKILQRSPKTSHHEVCQQQPQRVVVVVLLLLLLCYRHHCGLLLVIIFVNSISTQCFCCFWFSNKSIDLVVINARSIANEDDNDKDG
jgi:hypothetical protein